LNIRFTKQVIRSKVSLDYNESLENLSYGEKTDFISFNKEKVKKENLFGSRKYYADQNPEHVPKSLEPAPATLKKFIGGLADLSEKEFYLKKYLDTKSLIYKDDVRSKQMLIEDSEKIES
jgi:hypothetical protein